MSSKSKIIIHVEGGLVQAVYADSDIEIMVMDLDTEGADPERIINYHAIDGEDSEACIHFEEPQLESKWVEQTFKEVRSDLDD